MEHMLLLVSIGIFILIFGLPSMSIGFYGDHGFRYPHTQRLEPNYDVRAFSDFFIDNYKYFFVRVVSASDLAIHINRVFWFTVSAVAVYAVSYLFWDRNKLAGLLAASVYLSYPVLSSQRLWSVGFASSIAVFFACLSMVFELRILRSGFSVAGRVGAFLLYLLSVYTLEFFLWLPIITVLVPFYRFIRGRDRHLDLRNIFSFIILYVPLIAWLYLWETRAGRKASDGLIPDLFTLDVSGLMQKLGVPVYQLISGAIGKGFASFLLQVATLVFDVRNLWETSLSLLWGAVVCCLVFFALRRSESNRALTTLYVLFSVVWIGCSALVVAMGGMKGGSNGYIADRVNGGLSSGVAFMVSGLFVLGILGRNKVRAFLSCAVLAACLYQFMFSSLLQLRDWRYLGVEEQRIRAGLNMSGLIGEVRSSNPILLAGVPHVLSSFPHKSNPNFSGDHVYSDYRFTPLPLHERWPDAGALSGRLDTALYRIDEFHRVRCLDHAIVLAEPLGVDRRSGAPRTSDKHDTERVIQGGVYVRKARDGTFSATRLSVSNCSTVIPDRFRNYGE